MLKGLKAPSRRYHRTITAQEQRREILSRLDTLTQAIRQARARADKIEIANALSAALASTTAAQKHMESINE